MNLMRMIEEFPMFLEKKLYKILIEKMTQITHIKDLKILEYLYNNIEEWAKEKFGIYTIGDIAKTEAGFE